MIPVNTSTSAKWLSAEGMLESEGGGGDEWCSSDEVSPGRLPRGQGWAWVWPMSLFLGLLGTSYKHIFLLARGLKLVIRIRRAKEKCVSSKRFLYSWRWGGQQESASAFSQMPFKMLQFESFNSHSCGWQSTIAWESRRLMNHWFFFSSLNNFILLWLINIQRIASVLLTRYLKYMKAWLQVF